MSKRELLTQESINKKRHYQRTHQAWLAASHNREDLADNEENLKDWDNAGFYSDWTDDLDDAQAYFS